MKQLKGFAASGGIVTGVVCVYSQEHIDDVPHYVIPEKQLENEIRRVDEAFDSALETLRRMEAASRNIFGKQGSEIINAHVSILHDPGLKKKITGDIEKNRVNAEHAVHDVFESYLEKFTDRPGHFEEISHDLIDVRDRLLEAFGAGSGRFTCPIGEKEAVVVASDRLTPSMVMNIPPENALAFVTRQGGYTSHATILARTLGVPVVFGIDVENELACRCRVIVDGDLGKVIVDPDAKTVSYYSEKTIKQKKRMHFCEVRREYPAQTAEGGNISLKVNVSMAGELELLRNRPGEDESDIHYDGIGLLRTEFLFMGDREPPGEEEHLKLYREVSEAVSNRPVVVRMLDISPDKVPPYIKVPPGLDLSMDMRGARALLSYPELYATQARALLRAAADCNIKVLFPMIADIDDLNTFRGLLASAAADLEKEGHKYSMPATGIMFETPSAIMLSDLLSRYIDFSNIGTNDLLQYSVAASRESYIAQQRYGIMHPSVLKMIKMLVDNTKKAGIEACLCGELGAFEDFYPILLDIGLESFSVPASKFEKIKCELLHITRNKTKGTYEEYMKCETLRSQQEFLESLH